MRPIDLLLLISGMLLAMAGGSRAHAAEPELSLAEQYRPYVRILSHPVYAFS